MRIFKTNKPKAFSLIELAIVIGIVAVMTVVSYAGLTRSRSLARLKAAQREVATAIRLAQGYALQGKTQEYPSGSGNYTTPCGYGFRFTSSNETDYEIFYNTYNIGNFGYTSCDGLNSDPLGRGRQYVSGNPGSRPAEQFQLKDSVRRSGGSPSSYEIYFTVPHATAYNTSGSEITSGSITITLRIPGVAPTKTINFYPRGRLVESP